MKTSSVNSGSSGNTARGKDSPRSDRPSSPRRSDSVDSESHSSSSIRTASKSSATSPASALPPPPSATAQYQAAALAASKATAQNRASPSMPLKKEKFADLKWMWSRKLSPPNQLSREDIESAVIQSARVQTAIDRSTTQSTSSHTSGSGGSEGSSSSSSVYSSRDEAIAAAKRMFDSMFADINDTNVRASVYMMRKVFRTMYEGIRVNEDGIRQLHHFASKKIPVVLLPMHKSHIDYLLLSYVCVAYNLFPPHIVAGANLNMPIVGSILRHGGGLFIRRVFGNDELYKSVFYEYITLLLQNGHWLECFIEGTRSRMGKLKTPKIGFISVLVDLLVNGRLGDNADMMLVPIAISYDKVIEGSSYVSEMLGAKKQQETLTQTINSVNHVIRLNFGSIDVSICEGISLRQALGMQEAGASLRTSNPFLSMSQQEQKRVVMSLAHQICYEMNNKLVISATSVIATVLLTNFNRGISRKDLVIKAEMIKRMIIERGGSVAHIFHIEPMSAIVDRTLKVLGKLLQEQHAIVYGFRNVTSLELSFYRNQLLHMFISEGLMCVAMAAEYKDVRAIRTASSASANSTVDMSKLIDSVRFISKLLKFEFIYKPAPDLEENVEGTIEALIARGVLKARQGDAGEEGEIKDVIEGEITAGAPGWKGVALNSTGVETFLFLSMLVWPFIETYWVAMASLMALFPDVIMESKKLAEMASRRAEALFYSGHIEFYECLNTESIMNAYEWCISQGILRVHQVGATRMFQLTPEYQVSPEEHAAGTNIPLPQYQPQPANTQISSNPAAVSTHMSMAPPLPPPSSLTTKRHSTTSSTSGGRGGSSGAAAAAGIVKKSLKDLVLRVGKFRKIRLVASDSSKSLLENFVDELCTSDPATAAGASTATTVAANFKPTATIAAAQKLLNQRARL